jgi:hypothetical protein
MQHGVNRNVKSFLNYVYIMDSDPDLKNSLYSVLFHQKFHVIIRCTYERKQTDIPGEQDCRSS